MEQSKINVGVIGCGDISQIYFESCKQFGILNIAACADLVIEKAKQRAKQFDIPIACGPQEIFSNPDIDIVLNLTIPAAHTQVATDALKAGKHVYNEKPLTIKRQEGLQLLQLAKDNALRIGCAPDTFLGGGLQTCRKLIDDGVVGRPIAATAFMTCHGHESWHPAPEFYYKPGAGPMFDMGPYYLTAMISLMGPVNRVTGSGRITFPQRTITSEPKKGQTIQVETPTHIAGIMDFTDGAICTIITSFDVWSAQLPHIEIYGTKGTLSLADPNTFGGPVRVCLAGSDSWDDVPLTHGYTQQSRGIGLADMAGAIADGRPHRANGKMGYHVLDIMSAFDESSGEGRHITLESTCDKPAALPADKKL